MLNIHLPAARSPEETHAQIQVLQNPFALYHQLVHAVSLTKDVQVYFVTIDKKSKSVSLSHAKDNKVLFLLEKNNHHTNHLFRSNSELMRAAGCLFTSSTLPGIQSFPTVLVENFQLLQTKSKSAETGSG